MQVFVNLASQQLALLLGAHLSAASFFLRRRPKANEIAQDARVSPNKIAHLVVPKHSLLHGGGPSFDFLDLALKVIVRFINYFPKGRGTAFGQIYLYFEILRQRIGYQN